jgi:hypothetical protein
MLRNLLAVDVIWFFAIIAVKDCISGRDCVSGEDCVWA